MSDLTKEDETEYEDWRLYKGQEYYGPHHLAWKAACEYKNKRIKKLEAVIGTTIAQYDEWGDLDPPTLRLCEKALTRPKEPIKDGGGDD